MNTIFTNQNTAHLFELFLWILGAFLLGWILSRLFASTDEKIIEKEVIVEKKVFVDRIIYKDSAVSDTITAKNTAIEAPSQTSVNTVVDNLAMDIKEGSTPIKSVIASASTLNYSGFGKATEADKDDLKRISGIGLSIEKKLNNIGIFTYRQISKFSNKDMTDITDLITFFPGRIERDNWVLQATNLVKGLDTDFSKRVDKGDIYS